MSADNQVNRIIFRSPQLVLPGEPRGLIVLDLRHPLLCECKTCQQRRLSAKLPWRRSRR